MNPYEPLNGQTTVGETVYLPPITAPAEAGSAIMVFKINLKEFYKGILREFYKGSLKGSIRDLQGFRVY